MPAASTFRGHGVLAGNGTARGRPRVGAAWGCAAVAIGVAPAVARLRPVAAVAASCTPKHNGLTAKDARVIVYGQYTGDRRLQRGRVDDVLRVLAAQGATGCDRAARGERRGVSA